MKKTYSKPDIVFEDFSLSTSVASNCSIKAPANAPSVGNGAIQITVAGMMTFNIFVNETQGCNWFEEDGEWDGFCYHNPGEFNMLFIS